mgnify:FL=1|jgi:hypothetical protein|tara:strand:- start:1063 stop:1239 length:177 start_codon:yes stop_codon:yes gene_type:complete
MPTAYALVVLNIIAVLICYQMAKSRGGNPRFWGGLAVFFGPLVIPFVFFCKAKTESES